MNYLASAYFVDHRLIKLNNRFWFITFCHSLNCVNKNTLRPARYRLYNIYEHTSWLERRIQNTSGVTVCCDFFSMLHFVSWSVYCVVGYRPYNLNSAPPYVYLTAVAHHPSSSSTVEGACLFVVYLFLSFSLPTHSFVEQCCALLAVVMRCIAL